jgi:hypothetical protein
VSIDSIVSLLEDKSTHSKLVGYGWCSPTGKEITWQEWQQSAPSWSMKDGRHPYFRPVFSGAFPNDETRGKSSARQPRARRK